MIPDYKNAAAKAYNTRTQFGSSDPMEILRQLPNVMLIAFESSDMPVDQDAFTCVEKKKYIVFYNASLSPIRLRSSLARELGHVFLQHDGKDPEDIWMEEATCFAYHLLCPPPASCVEIKYRPDLKSLTMSFKSMQRFDSIDSLKQSIADEQTRISHFIGQKNNFQSDDIKIIPLNEKDIFDGWKNYSSVVCGGRLVGYCGE